MIDAGSYPMWVNSVVFTVAAAFVWWSGTRLVVHAERIARATGLTHGVAGLALLATATSLPEVATTVSGARLGASRLVVNNLAGGVAMQTAVLAAADLFAARGALTAFAPNAALLLQGVVLVVLLGATLAAAAGELPAIGHVGLGTVAVFALFLVGLHAARMYEKRPSWLPREADEATLNERSAETEEGHALWRHAAAFAGFAAVTFLAGWTVAVVGKALAEQSGLGSSFVGATLVAASTSLPEVSTTVAAARRGAFAMAVSNIFGSNAFCLALLLLGDVIVTEGPILEAMDASAMFAASLGLLLTGIYLWGLVERRDRTFLRLGVDSWAVLFVYAGGLVVLYRIRGHG